MSKITLPATVDEREFRTYMALRDAPRSAMAHGVYPNCKAALEQYATLGAALASDLADVTDYHAEITAPVAPYIAQLQQYMTAICAIVEAIEDEAPGTFGIALPLDEEQAPE